MSKRESFRNIEFVSQFSPPKLQMMAFSTDPSTLTACSCTQAASLSDKSGDKAGKAMESKSRVGTDSAELRHQMSPPRGLSQLSLAC